MAEYIEREALFKTVEDYASTHPVMNDNELFALFCSIPAADVVSRGAYDQTDWERCVALTQLKEIGKSFGERMDDVRPVVLCRDCKNNYNTCLNHGRNEPMCDFTDRKLRENDFCSRGVKREES